MGSKRTIFLILGPWAAGLFAVFLLWLVTIPPSTMSVAILWFTGAALLLAIAVWIASRPGTPWTMVSTTAQQLIPLLTISGIFVATGLYFLERRDKFRYAFSVEASAIRVATARGDANALLAIRVATENKGARQMRFRCVAIDILQAPETGQTLSRAGASEEMQLSQIPERINYWTPDSELCRHGEEFRARAAGRPVPGRPLFIWPNFEIEPGDVDNRYFEAVVSCRYPFVRVLVKFRINPEDDQVNEVKTIVPLADICRDRPDSSHIVSTPAVEGGLREAEHADPRASQANSH